MRGIGVWLATLLATAGWMAGPMGKLEVGQRFPDVSFGRLEGGAATSLKAYRGKKVVLHVFASW